MKKKIAVAFLASLLLNLLLAVPIQANSAQRHWSGTDSTGALVKDKSCPLVVDKELLTFDVQEFPKNYYNSIEEFLAYTGKVTAEYTFRNPADYTVTATLVFPFGNLPHYGEYIYDSPTDKYIAVSDTEKYGVKVNGEPIDVAVHHTLKARGTPFSLDEDMPKLTDGYISDSFFRPDLPVWVQQYSVEGISAENQVATAAFVLREDPSKTRVLWAEKNGIATLKDGIRISGWTKTGDTLTVYIFGEPPKDGIHMVTLHSFGNLILGQAFVGKERRLAADFDAFVFIVVGVDIPCPGLVLCHAEIAEVIVPHGGGVFNGFHLAFGVVFLDFVTVFVNTATAPLAEIFICPFVFDGNVGIPAGKRFYDGLGFRPCGLKPDTIIRHGGRFISVIPVCVPFGTPICITPTVPGGFAILPQVIPRLLAECKIFASDVCPRFKEALLACGRNIRQILCVDRPAERIHMFFISSPPCSHTQYHASDDESGKLSDNKSHPTFYGRVAVCDGSSADRN